jgi:hypothetical protein
VKKLGHLTRGITQRLISILSTERYYPNKWKKKTRPKEKNDKLSIYEEERQQNTGIADSHIQSRIGNSYYLASAVKGTKILDFIEI